MLFEIRFLELYYKILKHYTVYLNMNSRDPTDSSLTSTNKWGAYIPGKVFTLTPINIQDIRKQLLERAQEELEDTLESHQNQDDLNLDEVNNSKYNKCNLNNTTKDGETLFEKQLTQEEQRNIDVKKRECEFSSQIKSRSLEPLLEDTFLDFECENSNNMPTAVLNNKENIPSNVEPLNLSKDHKKNDSFDFDFSTLSLHTPVKRKEIIFNHVTPKINIIPPTETKSLKKPGQPFQTPKYNTAKQQFSFNKSSFKTPVNRILNTAPYSVKRLPLTPYHSVKKSTHPESYSIPENCGIQRHHIAPLIYPKEDEFKRITVNNVEYILMNILGKGGSSEVFHCFNPEEKLHVAIKLVSLSDPTTADGFINEVKLLKSLQKCDRIIKMFDYEIRDKNGEEKLIVVLEKGGEDLGAILKQLATKQSHLPTYMLLFYWLEMLHAVRQIHSNGVIHSDLKPANFLRAEGGLKLIDFGIASKVQEDMTCVYKSNQEGSCNYISPEALKIQTNANVNSPSYGTPKYKIHFKSDVWSLGCILYQLVYRKTPFQHINPIWAKLTAIVDPNHNINYPPVDWVSPRIVNTIKRCLQFDMKSRPSLDELIDEYEQLLSRI